MSRNLTSRPRVLLLLFGTVFGILATLVIFVIVYLFLMLLTLDFIYCKRIILYLEIATLTATTIIAGLLWNLARSLRKIGARNQALVKENAPQTSGFTIFFYHALLGHALGLSWLITSRYINIFINNILRIYYRPPDCPGLELSIKAQPTTLFVIMSFRLLLPLLLGALMTFYIWRKKRKQSSLIDWHGKAALNFQLTYMVISRSVE